MTEADLGIFKNTFPPELIQKIYEHSTLKSFLVGDTIIAENKYIHAIPIIAKGAIRVIRTEDDGREILLYYITAGESCIMSFLGGLHHDTSKVRAEAEEDTDILFLPIAQVIIFNREYPQWLEYIFRLYHQRFEELLTVINAIAFKKVDERLLLLLQKKSELTRSTIIHTTHEQLAGELGTARVVVSRLLKQLEEDGEVSLSRNKIILNQ